MSMRFTYTPNDNWPSLAWLAVCRPGGAEVEVTHGRSVHVREDWFAEAVWDGDFAAGGFDQTDLVFGSGGRVRGDAVVFVSSGTTVDRLHSVQRGGTCWISNSLACLLAAVDGTVDPNATHYFEHFESIIHGLNSYRRDLPTSAGTLRITYFHNLCWHGGRLAEQPKPVPVRDFGSFQAYRQFLEGSLSRIAGNMHADGRDFGYRWLASLSTGYDSPTGATVARKAGLQETLSFSHSRDGVEDSGAEIARYLGLRPIVVDSGRWKERRLAEVPFIASDAKGEDVYFGGAVEHLHGRVLLTGHGSVRVWDKGDALYEHLRRDDQAGLSLCEFRLWTGFLHCPLPFFGGFQTADLRRISRSREMTPWDVPGYSRPICRRIVEEAGVPRELFGMEKKAVSVLLFDRRSFLSEASLADYEQWRDRNLASRRYRSQRALEQAGHAARGALTAGIRAGQRVSGALAGVVPVRLLRRIATSNRLRHIGQQEPRFEHIFPWALQHAQARYTSAAPGAAAPH